MTEKNVTIKGNMWFWIVFWARKAIAVKGIIRKLGKIWMIVY